MVGIKEQLATIYFWSLQEPVWAVRVGKERGGLVQGVAELGLHLGLCLNRALCCAHSPLLTKPALNKEVMSCFCWGPLVGIPCQVWHCRSKWLGREQGWVCDGMGTGIACPVHPCWDPCAVCSYLRNRGGKAVAAIRTWGDALLSSQRWGWRNQSDLGTLSIKQGWSRLIPAPGHTEDEQGQYGPSPAPDGQFRCNCPILTYREFR